MDTTARKWYLLSRALEYQSRAARALMVNYDAPVFDSQWAEDEMKHIMEYQKDIELLKKDLKIIDNSIPF